MLATLKHYPRAVNLLLTATSVLTLARAITLPYLVIYLSGSFGLSVAEIGLVVGSTLIIGSLLSLYGGFLLDKLANFWLILIFSGLYALGFLGTFFTGELWLFYLCLVLINLALAVVDIAAKAGFCALLPVDERAEVFAIKYTLSNVGYAAGPLLGVAMLELNDHVPFLASALLGLAMCLAYWRLGDRSLQASAPDKPFFTYLAFQSPHTPHQAKPEDQAKYRGVYEAGWDALRQARFERQRAMGLIEPNAVLPPRNPGIPEWETLPAEQKALYARYMACYAGLVDNVDQNVGRLLAFLEKSGQLDNTLIMITSDNGANSIGGPTGVMNLQDRRQGFPEDAALVRRLVETNAVGDDATYAAYPSGWSQVSNTPYRFYKRTPMAGGIRVPFVVHWPQGLADPGGLRQQWIHVTDVLPTLLDLTGGSYPTVHNGYRTRHMDGKSFAASMGQVDAPVQRQRQYYELQGNRGYISGEWKIVSLQPPLQPLNLDNWMLFHIANDPTEVQDLAASQLEVLQRLIAEFEAEATANYVYPIDNRDDRRAITLPPHELVQALVPRDFYRESEAIPGVTVSPMIADRDFVLRAQFDWRTGDEGVIVALGDHFSGMVLFVMDGALHFTYQLWYRPIELAPIRLTPGEQDFVLNYRALGDRKGHGHFTLNGRIAADADLSPTLVRLPSGGLSVGINKRRAISDRYANRGAFSYSGRIDRVRLEPGDQPTDSPMMLDEAAVQARLRAAARQT